MLSNTNSRDKKAISALAMLSSGFRKSGLPSVAPCHTDVYLETPNGMKSQVSPKSNNNIRPPDSVPECQLITTLMSQT